METQLNGLTPQQLAMLQTFQQHMLAEMTGDLDGALATMVAEPYVNHVPVLTGGVGAAGVRAFYGGHLVGKFLPPMRRSPMSHAPLALTRLSKRV